jgi:hypothetical protein
MRSMSFKRLINLRLVAVFLGFLAKTIFPASLLVALFELRFEGACTSMHMYVCTSTYTLSASKLRERFGRPVIYP